MEEINWRINCDLSDGPVHNTTAFRLKNKQLAAAQLHNGQEAEYQISLLINPMEANSDNEQLITVVVAVDTGYRGYQPCKRLMLNEEKNGHRFVVIEIYN